MVRGTLSTHFQFPGSVLCFSTATLYQTLQMILLTRALESSEESSDRLGRVKSEERVIPSIETKQEEDMNRRMKRYHR